MMQLQGASVTAGAGGLCKHAMAFHSAPLQVGPGQPLGANTNLLEGSPGYPPGLGY